MGNDSNFSGTKIALLNRGAVVAYLRDDKPGIPFRGLWDLPGGGREGDEDPVTCALREVEEPRPPVCERRRRPLRRRVERLRPCAGAVSSSSGHSGG